MASKVNTKFVVGLGAGLVVVCGAVAGTAYFLLRNTAQDNFSQGQKLMAQQKYADAAIAFSKAVGKEQTNVEFLTQWREALSKQTPETQTTYREAFIDFAMRATRQLAIVQTDNVEAQRQYMDLRMEMIRGAPYSQDAYNAVLQDGQTLLAFHATKPAGPWEVLKRYTGMIAARMFFETPAARPDQIDNAIKDMEAALRANPADSEVAAVLVESWQRLADDAQRANRASDAQAHEQKARTLVETFLSANPDEPTITLLKVQRDLGMTLRQLEQARQEGRTADPDAAGKDFAARALPLIDAAFAKAKAGPQPVPLTLISQMRTLEPIADAASRLRRTRALLEQGIAADPKNAEFVLSLAALQADVGEHDQAVRTLEPLATMPNQPVSVRGMNLFAQRPTALALQARWACVAADRLPAGDERTAAVTRAKELRDKLAAIEPTGPRLAIVDAQLAVIDGTPPSMQRAAQLLEGYNRDTNNSDPVGVVLAAQVAIRNQEPGRARDLLRRAVQLQPTNIAAMLTLADIEARLQNYAAAKDAYELVLRVMPDNEPARRGLGLVQALTGEGDAGDPVIAALVELDRIAREGESTAEGAQQLIESARRALAQHDDPRMYSALATAQLRAADRTAALATVEEGLRKFPDNPALTQVRTALTSDPLEAAMANVDRSNVEPIEKLLIKSQLQRNAGNTARADEFLAQAAAMNTDDRRVVEILFLQALDKRDMPAAQALVEKAARLNSDGYAGDTFRARLLAIQGDSRQAATILRQVIDRGGATPELYRLMARVQNQLGRGADAAAALRSSLRLRPDDPGAATELVNTLMTIGQVDDALTVARESRRFAEGDAGFVNLWLRAETMVGDRELALRSRERLHIANPNNRDNAVALASMYVEALDWPKARTLIDEVRAKADGPDIAGIDALWHWNQNQRSQAVDLLRAFLAKDPANTPGESAIAIARFLAERGDTNGAIATLEAARDQQDKATMPVDKALSDLATSTMRREIAVAASRAIVEANADTPEQFYRKRLTEQLINMRDLDGAQAQLAALAPTPDAADLITTLLEAELAGARNDTRAQRAALDRAVARFPNEPRAFLSRGRVLARDASTRRDALADASRAVDLAPESIEALRLRSGIHLQFNDTPAAVADIRSAVRLAPRNTDLVGGALSDLLRLGREQDAVDLAAEVAQRRNRDNQLLASLGGFFLSANRADVGRRYFRDAFDLDQKNLAIAQSYLDAQLNFANPDLNEASRVLGLVEKQMPTNPGLLIAAGKLRAAQGRVAEAARFAQDALRLINPADNRPMTLWFTELERMFTDRAQLRQVLEATARQGLAPEWMNYFRAMSQSNEPGATGVEALSQAEQVVSSASAPEALRAVGFRSIGAAHYTAQRHEDAVRVWQAGLSSLGEQADLLNNIAFVMGKHLNRVPEAITAAERAVALAPNQPDFLDTLGVTYVRADRVKDALPLFEKALAGATTTAQSVIIATHYAEALQKDGQLDQAKLIVRRALDTAPNAATGTIPPDVMESLQNLSTSLGLP